MNGDYLTALKNLKKISSEKSLDPHLSMQCGYLALKTDNKNEALEYFKHINEEDITQHLQQCRYFFLSHLYKDLGDLPNYHNYQKKLNNSSCKKLRGINKKTKNLKHIQSAIMIDMQFPEPIEY